MTQDFSEYDGGGRPGDARYRVEQRALSFELRVAVDVLADELLGALDLGVEVRGVFFHRLLDERRRVERLGAVRLHRAHLDEGFEATHERL